MQAFDPPNDRNVLASSWVTLEPAAQSSKGKSPAIAVSNAFEILQEVAEDEMFKFVALEEVTQISGATFGKPLEPLQGVPILDGLVEDGEEDSSNMPNLNGSIEPDEDVARLRGDCR